MNISYLTGSLTEVLGKEAYVYKRIGKTNNSSPRMFWQKDSIA